MAWLGNSYRTRGVPAEFLRSSPKVTVVDCAETLSFLPLVAHDNAAIVFICGSGVSARAYAPLTRPLAEAGHAVFIVKLPLRFAILESHKRTAVERARSVIASHPEIRRWVIAGHSLGGALACRLVLSDPKICNAMVLIGTTHPKEEDLSNLPIAVTKVIATNDGVATAVRTLAGKKLLPQSTRWIEIPGGNHSQFGHYGHQLFDGKPGISREKQQEITREALLGEVGRASRQ